MGLLPSKNRLAKLVSGRWLVRVWWCDAPKKLHVNDENDVCVKYHTWKIGKAKTGNHPLFLYGALVSEEAGIDLDIGSYEALQPKCLLV